MQVVRFSVVTCTIWLLAVGGDTSTTPIGTTLLRKSFGVIQSPKFPAVYPNNLRHSWTISAQKGYRVVVYFSAFAVEESYANNQTCVQDFVSVMDGDTNSNRTIAKLCGSSSEGRSTAPALIRQKFRSTGGQLTLRMVSDYSNPARGDTSSISGFRANYYSEDRNECAEMAQKTSLEDDWSCQHFCNNYPGGFYCSCRPGYRLHANKHSCSGVCSAIDQSASVAVITPPGFPGSYSRLTDCIWKVQGDAGKNVYLNFNADFDVEAHTSGACAYDWVKIVDSSGDRGTFCGNAAPNGGRAIKSKTNWIEVHFHSDWLTEASGFRIDYAVRGVRCDLLPPPSNGAIVHPTLAPGGAAVRHLPFSGLVRYSCDNGFRMFGSAKATCLKDGTLSARPPRCIGL